MYAGTRLRHLFTNLEVDLDGNSAKARAYLIVTSTKEGNTAILNTGQYECLLGKIGGSWLFKERRVLIDGTPS